MAIKLFRKPEAGSFAEIPDMLDIEPSSGEEREVETKKYISREDDYEDFDVGSSTAPEYTVTFEKPVAILEQDYDDKTGFELGILYTSDNLEVLHAKAKVTSRKPVKLNDKPHRQYTIKTAGKPVINDPATVLTA